MASPVKSISFRRDSDGIVCLHKKVKKGSYKSIADFWFRIECFVQFKGTQHADSGYLFNVMKRLGGNDVSR